MCFNMKTCNFTETRIKTKKIHCVLELEFNQSQLLKLCIAFNTKRRIEAEKIMTKMEKRCTN